MVKPNVTVWSNMCLGLQQAGLPATIAHCISLLPADIRGMFWANIGLIGGTTKFHGFRERLYVLTPELNVTRLNMWTQPHRAANVGA